MSAIVTFRAEDGITELSEVRVSIGSTILEAEQLAGISADAYCGGKGTCGKCKVLLDGEIVHACKTKVTKDSCVTLLKKKEQAVILTDTKPEELHFEKSQGSETETSQPSDHYFVNPKNLVLAVDIGTTTVVCYLLDRSIGKVLGIRSCLNPQKSFGADVVARCSYALEHEGGEIRIASCIREVINEMAGELAGELGLTASDIQLICMVGNSGMHHLFLKWNLRTLALAPYTPVSTELQDLKAADYGIRIDPEGRLIWLPLIGGFVGADTVGCLVATDMDSSDDMTLMIDIGTNGEMVLGNRSRRVACSTAAGPAFEGAKITCGMRGAEGAIDHVWIEDGKLCWHVIGDTEPIGICGSGLLDAAACLLELGRIDDSGRMEETCYFTEHVFLNQKDVRELQLAKAAIAAGIVILCDRMKIRIKQIDRLLIAGAFGNYLDPDSACRIGLLPPVLRNKIIPIGNAAGEGAKRCAVSEAEMKRSCRLARETEFIELALDPEFQDIYVDELGFDTE